MWIESFAEFRMRMDCEFIETPTGYLFRNGAQSNGDVHIEPPDDEFARLRLQREWLMRRLARLEKEARDYKAEVLEQASLASRYANLPGPPSDAPSVLASMKAVMDPLRAELSAINARLSDSPQAQRDAVSQRLDQERRQNISAIAHAVKDINI